MEKNDTEEGEKNMSQKWRKEEWRGSKGTIRREQEEREEMDKQKRKQ